MALVRAIPFGRDKSGQLQEVLCPRCKTVLEGQEISEYGKGVNIREVIGEYHCLCGYEITLTERYPIINRALETERHI